MSSFSPLSAVCVFFHLTIDFSLVCHSLLPRINFCYSFLCHYSFCFQSYCYSWVTIFRISQFELFPHLLPPLLLSFSCFKICILGVCCTLGCVPLMYPTFHTFFVVLLYSLKFLNFLSHPLFCHIHSILKFFVFLLLYSLLHVLDSHNFLYSFLYKICIFHAIPTFFSDILVYLMFRIHENWCWIIMLYPLENIYIFQWTFCHFPYFFL